jgi:hypothetical protein
VLKADDLEEETPEFLGATVALGQFTVFVVPDPPLVRRSLGIALRRVLPRLLASERSDVEIVPGASHLLVATVIDKVSAEHLVAVADERIRAVPLVHSEILVEVCRQRIPGNELPAHPCLQALDVLLQCSRRKRESCVAGVQMGWVSYLVGHHGAANAGMLGPAFHAGLEERTVDNQLMAALEQVEQAYLTLSPNKSQNNNITNVYNVIVIRALLPIVWIAKSRCFQVIFHSSAIFWGAGPNFCMLQRQSSCALSSPLASNTFPVGRA